MGSCKTHQDKSRISPCRKRLLDGSSPRCCGHASDGASRTHCPQVNGDILKFEVVAFNPAGGGSVQAHGVVSRSRFELEQRARFRSLDRLVLRGRVEPVEVHVQGGRRGATDMPVTQFGSVPAAEEPDGLRLVWLDLNRLFASQQMPVILGRSPQASFCVDDSRVSRSHARVDWHSGNFQLSDLSYNGTYVRFNDGEIVSLRRGSCILHGNGSIGLGASPIDPTSACVRFDVLRFGDTQPQPAP